MLSKLLTGILSIPKTVYFNFSVFRPGVARHLPVRVCHSVRLRGLRRGAVVLEGWEKSHYKVKLGFGGSEHIIPNSYGLVDIRSNESRIIFKGPALLARGSSLRVAGGCVTFGRNFMTNRNCVISSSYRMDFGDDVLVGWNCSFRDTDGHTVIRDGEAAERHKRVSVGNHTWICSFSDLQKGAEVGNDCVVSWRSCVTKAIEGDHLLIGGLPAKALRDGISWEK